MGAVVVWRGMDTMDLPIRRGVLWGLFATAAMTLVMSIGMLTGLAPMPEPIPVALAALLLPTIVPKPALMLSGLVAHFAYGALAGALFVRFSPRIDVLGAVVFAVALWVVMQVAFLPALGWGLFGSALTLRIAVATLVLHVIYGAVLGLVGRGATHAVDAAAPSGTAP